MGEVNRGCSTTQQHHDQIESHVAWKNNLQEDQAELLLEGRAPFSYILRSGEREHTYFITFVKRNGAIKHHRFMCELDNQKWCYPNRGAEGPAEIFSDTVDDLIPLIMHCRPENCIPR